ncbi:MAG: hypothetical protein M9919_00185 [Burkholderiaceae bacterium]|jgi:hypothetical protein|nr:hypothetical protein [Burkholderiaceae bacterium]MCO5102401.1 hypothetical protein [Burkholderiaceae bacterium]
MEIPAPQDARPPAKSKNGQDVDPALLDTVDPLEQDLAKENVHHDREVTREMDSRLAERQGPDRH